MRYAKEKKKEEKLIPLTCRFTESAYQVISEVAAKNHLSKSEIVRLAADQRLISYLSSVLWVEEEQGDRVLEELMKIGTELSGIRRELKRIGINYNQEVKLKNIEAKYGKRVDSPVLMKKKDSEMQAVMKDTNIFKRREFNNVIRHFDNVSKEMGDKIYRLIG